MGKSAIFKMFGSSKCLAREKIMYLVFETESVGVDPFKKNFTQFTKLRIDLSNIIACMNSQFAKSVLYADDANIIITGKSIAEVDAQLRKLCTIFLKSVDSYGLCINL